MAETEVEVKETSRQVKIQIAEDTENVIAVNYPIESTIKNLKDDISKKFKVTMEDLLVFQNGDEICNEHLLEELDLNEFGIIEIVLTLTTEALDNGIKLDSNVYYSHFTLPEIITVHVPLEDENGEKITKELVVEIETKTIQKPFLGGFVHTKTKIEYHHAFTQTGPAMEQIQKIKEVKCSRDTQTIEYRQCSVDTNKDECTQHFGDSKELLYQSVDSDILLMANDAFDSSDNIEARRNLEGMVRRIQKNFRLYRLRKCLRECAAEFRRIVALRKKQEERSKKDYINSQSKSKDFPRTKKDFDVLFAQIAKWKESEMKRISREFTGPTRVIEMQSLLEKEIQLLNGIEKRRLEIQDEIQAARHDRILKECGEPIKWIGQSNALVEMDTLSTQRARRLTELYNLLREPMTNLDDRLRLLNDISEALSKENTRRILELEDLFERERQLLKCKVKNDMLKVLHQRQLTVFMCVIQEDDQKRTKKSITKVCEKCKSVLPMKKFVMHSKHKTYDLCQTCAGLQSSKTDLSVYRAILRVIQRDERKRGALSSIAFIIQETDIKNIIENIWHGMSILSQCTDNLRLCRWNINEEWSPWNCICLTETEAKIHVKCLDLEAVYGEKVIAECRARHSLAKSSYKQLKKIDAAFIDWEIAGIKDRAI